MRESLDISTQLTQVTEVDVTRIVQLRAKAKDGFAAREGAKLTFLPFFVQASAEALQQHPALNASMTEDYKQITYHGSENIAIAVDTPKGLLVPVIKNASDLGIAGMAKAIGDLGGAHAPATSPRGAVGFDLHHHQHWFLRCTVRHPDHQPAERCNPRYRFHREAPHGCQGC